jgi:hypothetical protein
MLNLQDIFSLMDKKYELISVDYREDLSNSLEIVQHCIQKQDPSKLDESIWEGSWEAEIEGVDCAIKELEDEVIRCLPVEAEEAIDFIEEHRDEIEDEIRNRDHSNPLDDLIRHTTDPVCFYDTGLEWSGNYDTEAVDECLKEIKHAFGIDMDKYDARLTLVLEQASYGGQIVVYFLGDIEHLLFGIDDADTIVFENPTIACIDTVNGSGDHTELYGLKFALPLNMQNLFLDRCIKYSYVYQVCGLSEDFCASTDVTFVKTSRQDIPPESGLHSLMDQEHRYQETFKKGGCTFLDMDISRHRDVYYRNDYPCGNKCPHCSTFWID